MTDSEGLSLSNVLHRFVDCPLNYVLKLNVGDRSSEITYRSVALFTEGSGQVCEGIKIVLNGKRWDRMVVSAKLFKNN